MGDSGSTLLLITVVALLATIVFFIAYSLPQKIAATALILLIPFQPVDTQHGTANVFLTFVLFIAMLMREKNVRLPMLPQTLILLFAYLISMGLAHPSTYVQHGLYLFYLLSAFLVFWISYDLTFRYQSVRGMIQVFLVMNVLVIIYCFIQLAFGTNDKFRLFGLDEFAMMPVRDDYRLTGPFGAAGPIAEYFVIMVFLIVHQVLTTAQATYRRGLVILLAINLLLLVATGNRGGFLVLVGASMMLLWMFRHLLGVARTLQLAIVGVVLFSISAAITVNYTDFDRLFDRLLATELEEGIPDTRTVVWPMAWEEIQKKPIFGHGPRLRLEDEELRGKYKGHVIIFFPHNLYLFLLFTIGITGLLAFLIYLATPLFRCWRLSKRIVDDPETLSLAKIGIVVMTVFFIDQIKVEFMRYSQVDYWHFVFALLGFLIAFCDRTEAEWRSRGDVRASRLESS